MLCFFACSYLLPPLNVKNSSSAVLITLVMVAPMLLQVYISTVEAKEQPIMEANT